MDAEKRRDCSWDQASLLWNFNVRLMMGCPILEMFRRQSDKCVRTYAVVSSGINGSVWMLRCVRETVGGCNKAPQPCLFPLHNEFPSPLSFPAFRFFLFSSFLSARLLLYTMFCLRRVNVTLRFPLLRFPWPFFKDPISFQIVLFALVD